MAAKHSTWHVCIVKAWIFSMAAGALAVATTACERGPTTSVDGAHVFQSVCATCHGPTGKPPEAMVARLNVRDLTSPELRARVTPALVENQVRKGSQNKLMPALEGALTDEQIKAVAAYVASPAFLDRK